MILSVLLSLEQELKKRTSLSAQPTRYLLDHGRSVAFAVFQENPVMFHCFLYHLVVQIWDGT